MRNLINIIQQLLESKPVGMSANEITKYDWRFQKFINKILAREPFTTIDNNEVIIDPREAARFQKLYKDRAFVGKLVARATDGSEIPLSKLAKTTEFGGAAVAVGQEQSEAGKEGLVVKPSQIGICDKDIPAADFYDVIKNNPVLNSTDYGKVIITLADYIVSGEYVMLPPEYLKKDKEKVRKAIIDYAGEYLGVLALIYDQSRFPRKADFEKWLGGAANSLVLNFPSKANTNIADSYATIANPKTKHTLNISSKGTGGGAAPAISGLKIPTHVKANPKFKKANQFIELCQQKGTVQQAFNVLDFIYSISPESINKKWHKFLPFAAKAPDLPMMAKQSINNKKKRIDTPLPKQYSALVADIAATSAASDGGKLVYGIKKEAVKAINKEDAIPNLEAAILEILEMNFIQQYTDYKGGQLTFATQWPAKLDGRISVESKCSAVDPTAGGFSFKLGRTDSDVGDEPDEEVMGDTEDEEDFVAKATDITTAKRTPTRKQPEVAVGNVGRAKRRK